MKKSLLLLVIALFFTACATNNKTAKNTYSYKQNSFISQNYKTKALEDFSNKFNLSAFDGTRIGGDCSGLITAINAKHNNAIFNPKELDKYFNSGRKSQAMFNLYKDKKQIVFDKPQVGDLVFFHNTTKQTKKAKKKLITHVGIVSNIKNDGTVEFLHNTRGKNTIGVMNLKDPNKHQSGKKKINSYIISNCSSASCLVSNRFSGFGRVK